MRKLCFICTSFLSVLWHPNVVLHLLTRLLALVLRPTKLFPLFPSMTYVVLGHACLCCQSINRPADAGGVEQTMSVFWPGATRWGLGILRLVEISHGVPRTLSGVKRATEVTEKPDGGRATHLYPLGMHSVLNVGTAISKPTETKIKWIHCFSLNKGYLQRDTVHWIHLNIQVGYSLWCFGYGTQAKETGEAWHYEYFMNKP